MTEEEPLGAKLNREAREAAAADPIRAVVIVRESLNMSPGKIGAQCFHAGRLLEKLARELANHCVQAGFKADQDDTSAKDKKHLKELHDRLLLKITDYANWEWHHDYGVIVKSADDKEFEKVKALYPEWDRPTENAIEKSRVLIVDKGYTEVAPNSETVIALWPMRVRDWPPLIKRLRLVK